MQFAALSRWHWIVIAVLIGLVIGLVRSADDGDLHGINVNGYGLILADQQQFENSLIQDYEGTRLFSDPVIYPHRSTDAAGKPTLVYIVAGRYWDGHPREKNGKTVAEWLPRCFIATTPYKPRVGLSDGSGKVIQEFPTVIEFMGALRNRYGVSCRYAWWAVYPAWTSLGICTVLIGGVWPIVINLLTWGRFTRPPEAKALSLWGVRAPKAPPSTPKPAVQYSGPDDLEEQLHSAATSNPTSEEASTPNRLLATGPLDAVTQRPADEREFAADDDDFYPTERHPHAKPPR